MRQMEKNMKNRQQDFRTTKCVFYLYAQNHQY